MGDDERPVRGSNYIPGRKDLKDPGVADQLIGWSENRSLD